MTSPLTQRRKQQSPLNVGQVRKAAVALLKHLSNEAKARIHAARSNDQPIPLFDEDDHFISLIISLKRIPDKKTVMRPKLIRIPHSLYRNTDPQLCIFVKEPQLKIKELFASQSVPVQKVIGLKKLRTRYKSFQSRRELCQKYQLFLADHRIMTLLAPLIGKYFFRRKKQPVPVKLSKEDLVEEISKARDSTYLFLNSGSCCAIKVGRSNFEAEELVENIVAAANGAAALLPKSWSGIQSIHLKATDSIALPIYNSLPELPQTITVSSEKRLESSSGGKDDKNSVENNPDAGSDMEVEELKTVMNECEDPVTLKQHVKTREKGKHVEKLVLPLKEKKKTKKKMNIGL